jgi:type VI secretion system protein ImpA
MMANDNLDVLVQQLLSPLAGSDPAGRWMRYERSFTDMARLREEDDPLLPMGEWERPLLKADWRKVADACTRMLAEDTKDFQVAAWLCDAWIRTAHLGGLCAGLDLIAGIAERYWTAAWPALEADDADKRVAPFVWMNAHLPLTLRLSVFLLPSALHREMPITLLEWERATSADDARSVKGERPSRREVRESVKPVDAEWLRQVVLGADKALDTLNKLIRCLDVQLKEASPSLSKLTDTIEGLRQAAQSLLQELEASMAEMSTMSTMSASAVNDTATVTGSPIGALSAPEDTNLSALANAGPTFTATSNSLHDRKQAYAALVSIASYLQSVEPHSPTPYLIQRAVELGQMSLPDMIKEVNTSAGSLDRFFELLGISPPR